MPSLELVAVVAAGLGALASGVAAITSVQTLKSQERATRRDEALALAATLFSEWRSLAQRTGRYVLEHDLPQYDPFKGVEGLPSELREHFIEVGNYCNLVGLLALSDRVDRALVRDYLGSSYVRLATIMRPFIISQTVLREGRGDPRVYQGQFLKLAGELGGELTRSAT